MGHGADGERIECNPDGHCRWTARTPIADARLRLYEANRGPLPLRTTLENTCGMARCVNLDHLRVARSGPAPIVRKNAKVCVRGHDLATNAVRHRDGRVAYCRICRNERRRERYHHDRAYAAREMERQRIRRRVSL